jgi:hypothetical protein
LRKLRTDEYACVLSPCTGFTDPDFRQVGTGSSEWHGEYQGIRQAVNEKLFDNE